MNNKLFQHYVGNVNVIMAHERFGWSAPEDWQLDFVKRFEECLFDDNQQINVIKDFRGRLLIYFAEQLKGARQMTWETWPKIKTGVLRFLEKYPNEILPDKIPVSEILVGRIPEAIP